MKFKLDDLQRRATMISALEYHMETFRDRVEITDRFEIGSDSYHVPLTFEMLIRGTSSVNYTLFWDWFLKKHVRSRTIRCEFYAVILHSKNDGSNTIYPFGVFYFDGTSGQPAFLMDFMGDTPGKSDYQTHPFIQRFRNIGGLLANVSHDYRWSICNYEVSHILKWDFTDVYSGSPVLDDFVSHVITNWKDVRDQIDMAFSQPVKKPQVVQQVTLKLDETPEIRYVKDRKGIPNAVTLSKEIMAIARCRVSVIVVYKGKFFAQMTPGVCSYDFRFPGGSIDPGESPEEAAIREVKEEARLIIPSATPFSMELIVYDSPKDWVRDVLDPKFWWCAEDTIIFVAEWLGDKYHGSVNEYDRDDLVKYGKWHSIYTHAAKLPTPYRLALNSWLQAEDIKSQK